MPAEASFCFPDVSTALSEPNGLLAQGGDLQPDRILYAYRHGIFPWYSHDQPILWWSPDPRAILWPQQLKLSRSFRKTLKQNRFEVSLNLQFEQVIEGCSAPRKNYPGTWLTSEMKQAYLQLHKLGHVHSVETWYQGELVGGLYGLAMGRVFFGESMFSRRAEASKIALAYLVALLRRWRFEVIDCQQSTEHLHSLGATAISRTEFIKLLDDATALDSSAQNWSPRALTAELITSILNPSPV